MRMSGGTYGKPKARRWSSTDRRYSSYRWRKTRLAVLRRDGYRCWVRGSPQRGDVCDHIDAVTAATSDAEFYDPRRLRASCRNHNLARGYIGEAFEAQWGLTPRPLQPRPSLRSGPASGVITGPYMRRLR
jgi:hypothetical protein